LWQTWGNTREKRGNFGCGARSNAVYFHLTERTPMRFRCTLSFFRDAAAPGAAFAQARIFIRKKQGFRVVTLTRVLDHPWALAFLPMAHAGDRAARAHAHVTKRGARREALKNVPRCSGWPGGMLDVIPDARFCPQPDHLLRYSERGEGGAGHGVARAVLARTMRNVRVIYASCPRRAGSLQSARASCRRLMAPVRHPGRPLFARRGAELDSGWRPSYPPTEGNAAFDVGRKEDLRSRSEFCPRRANSVAQGANRLPSGVCTMRAPELQLPRALGNWR